MAWLRQVAIVPALLIAASAVADRWGPVPAKWTSPDWKFALRCEPGFGILSLVDLRSSKPRVMWTKTSPLKGYPHHVVFSPDGSYIVLVDRHGGLGRDEVLAIIGPGGTTHATYQLSDFLPESEIIHAASSISSTEWRRNAPAYIRSSTRQFVLFSATGTMRVFDLATGRRVKLNPSQELEMRQDAARRYRPRLATGGIRAAIDLGVIGDRQDGPAIAHLMRASNDPSMLAWAYRLLMRDDAAPEFELLAFDPKRRPQLDTWIQAMPDGPKGRAALRRLSFLDPVVFANSTYVEGIWTADDVRRNPGWLTASDRQLRWVALRELLANPIQADLPIIERSLKSEDSAEHWRAFRALVAVRPRDLQIRLRGLRHNAALRDHATIELARLGDPAALDEIRTSLFTRDRRFLGNSTFRDVCILIAERQHSWGRDALLPYVGKKDDIDARGALAGLGDRGAILSVRRDAEFARIWVRWSALEWLVRLKDSEARRLLELATHDEDPLLTREAAAMLRSWTYGTTG